MIRRSVVLGLGVVLVAAVVLVACDDDTPACAAPAVGVPVAVTTYRPQPRPTFRAPTQPRQSTRVTLNPPKAGKTTAPKPSSWKDVKQPPHTWGQPYGKGRPVPPQPTVTVHYGHDYRVYPGYAGYYAPGYFPPGYGARYGCTADEREPEDD